MFVHIPLQTPIPPNSPVERLVRMLDELCAVIAARRAGGVLTVPLFFLLWNRVRHTAVRAIKLAARIAAGTPPRITRPRTTPRPPRPPTLRLPRGFAWVAVVVPGTAVYGLKLQYLMAQPELAPLLADPRMRRLLNPLYHMLGVPKPPPPPPQPAAAAPKPTKPPKPDRGSAKSLTGRDPPPPLAPLAA